MKFKSYEKSAVTCLLALIVGADGEIHERELALSSLFFAKLGMTTEDLQAGEAMSSAQAFSIISGMASDKRKLVCALLGDVIMVDGDVDAREMAVWRAISSICNFPEMNIGEAHNIVVNYFGV